jgi:hypothetical protein
MAMMRFRASTQISQSGKLLPSENSHDHRIEHLLWYRLRTASPSVVESVQPTFGRDGLA